MRMIKGDVKFHLPLMITESVDLVVTDPAYPTISGGSNDGLGSNKPGGILKPNDGKIFKHNSIKPCEFLPDLYRIMKPVSHIYLMTNFLNLELFLDEMRKTGFGIHTVLVWNKNNATPSGWYMKNMEYVIFGRKGPAMRINDCGSKSCHEFDNVKGVRSHPTEKPIDLLEMYINNSSNPGGLVLDPFSGSGSTGVACANLNRDFLGIEIDPEYYSIACNRLGL